MKNTIQKMVNLWWKDSIEANLNENLESTSFGTQFQYNDKFEKDVINFKATLESNFPDLQFTYSLQTNELLLLTEC
jgi:hypothetical protein